ncbi:hypothetical protein EAF00_011330 [Botryotinia globosa]|nr:hypothetical protein EAF00_011330 [Botryotinia globosa]
MPLPVSIPNPKLSTFFSGIYTRMCISGNYRVDATCIVSTFVNPRCVSYSNNIHGYFGNWTSEADDVEPLIFHQCRRVQIGMQMATAATQLLGVQALIACDISKWQAILYFALYSGLGGNLQVCHTRIQELLKVEIGDVYLFPGGMNIKLALNERFCGMHRSHSLYLTHSACVPVVNQL